MLAKLLSSCFELPLSSCSLHRVNALWRQRAFHLLVILFIGAVCGSLAFYSAPRPIKIKAPKNKILVGQSETIRISRKLPLSFDNVSATEILELRRQIVQEHSGLFESTYNPQPAVFSKLQGITRWFGTEGYYFYGTGADSVRGPTVAAQEILNPFRLVSADFFGLTIWENGGLNWNFEKATPLKISQPLFPLYPEATGVVWNSELSQALVSYRVSTFLEASAPYLKKPLTTNDVRFSLNSINARDWGFDYLAISTEELQSIESDAPLNTVIANQQSYAPTTLCGLSGSCIHSTDPQPEVASLKATKLPARMKLKLWRDVPLSADGKADFEFTIELL